MASKRKTREWPSQGRLELSWDAENRQQWVFFFFNYYFYFGCARSWFQHVGPSSLTRDQIQAPCIAGRVLATGLLGKSHQSSVIFSTSTNTLGKF